MQHEGHMGIISTKSSLRLQFFWPGMSKDIKKFINNCHECTYFSSDNKSHPIINVSDSVNEPWDTLAIDFVGPSHRLKDHLFFSVIDYYSRFPFVFVASSLSSECAIKVLETLFSMFGFPRKIISDNASAFTSLSFENFINRCNIMHNFSSTYYPQSNGTVERFHRTLKGRMEKMLLENLPFESSLAQCMMDIRSTPHSSTGETPLIDFLVVK